MVDFSRTTYGARADYDVGLRAYMLQIYNYMAAALVLTSMVAFTTLNFEPLARAVFNIGPDGTLHGFTPLGVFFAFAPLGINLYFFFGYGSLNVQTARMLFWAYAALNGVSLASLGLVYTGMSIARTVLIAGSVFASMSIYGYTTKRDLTSVGSFLVMGLIGLVASSLVNIYLNSPAIYFVTSIAGVAIFIGLIAWDTQKLKSYYYSVGGGELGQKVAVMGAFTLYLDFLNLFLYLLRFFGQRREN